MTVAGTRPSNSDIDSHKLRHRLRLQAIGGILVTSIIAGSIANFEFYELRRQSTFRQVQAELQFGVLALGARLKEYKNIARQITSRTGIRQLLERYDRGKLTLSQLAAATEPELIDAIRFSSEIVGITRLGRNFEQLAAAGTVLPASALPAVAETGSMSIGLPFRHHDTRLIAIAAPVLTSDHRHIGTDLVVFDLADSIDVVERLSSQFPFASRILFTADDGAQKHFFSLRADSRSTSAIESDQAIGADIGTAAAGIREVEGDDGTDRLLIHLPIPEAGWTLLFEADSARVLQQAQKDAWYLFTLVLSLMVFGTFVTLRLIRPTVVKLQGSEKQLRELNERNQELLAQTLKSKRLLDDVLNHTDAVVFIKDLQGRYIHANQAFAEERGLPVDALIGKTDFDLHPEETAQMFRENDRKAMASQSPIVIEERFEIEGRLHSFVTTKFPLKDQDESVYAICGIATDITEIRRSEELKRELEAAKAANRAKSVFLANMSHELRTPLHGILSFAEIGRNRIDTVSKDKLRQYYENIHTSGQRLLSLLNDLLDLSKLEAGKLELIYEGCDIGEIIDDCIAEQAPAIESKSIRILRTNSGIDTRIEGDRKKIFQVIRNLLSNAIKFSPPGGRIEFAMADKECDRLELRVIDEGDGIETDELEKIFDKFIQSQNTHPGGTGLGLSISREIVMLHQGEIWAENNARRGATIVIRLPRAKPASAPYQ